MNLPVSKVSSIAGLNYGPFDYESNDTTKTMTTSEREKGKKRRILTVVPNHIIIIQEHTQKEKDLMSCLTRLGTVYKLYPSIGNSYNSSSWDRTGRCSGISIHIVPIRQYVIHRTQHSIPVVPSSRIVLHRHLYQVIKYQHDTIIEQSTSSTNCI